MQRPPVPAWRRIATPIALAIVSLAAALVLWIAVTDAENPRETLEFEGNIEVHPVNVPDGLAVKSISPQVIGPLTISVAEADLDDLTPSDFRAEVDLAGVRQSVIDREVRVKVTSDLDVDVLAPQPPFVTVTLERVASKEVPVIGNPVGSLPQGYGLEEVVADPAVVRVTGAESLVEQVTRAVADINLTGLRTNLEQQVQLTARDLKGSEITVALDPGTATISLKVRPLELTSPVPVVVQHQGAVAEGYYIAGITIDPTIVSVTGNLETLQALTSINTEPVDVSGQRAEINRSVPLRPVPGVQLSRDSVNVRIRIEPAPGQIALDVVPQVANVPEGLRATLQTNTIRVIVAGALPDLNALSASSVTGVVDLAGLQEGVHQVTPRITVPQGIEVVAVNPPQVGVELRP